MCHGKCRKPEVNYFDVGLEVDHDVRKFQVPVDDPVLVQERHRLENLVKKFPFESQLRLFGDYREELAELGEVGFQVVLARAVHGQIQVLLVEKYRV